MGKLTKSSSLKNPLIPASYFWTRAPVLYLSASTCILQQTFSGKEYVWAAGTLHKSASFNWLSLEIYGNVWDIQPGLHRARENRCCFDFNTSSGAWYLVSNIIWTWTLCFLCIVSNTLQRNVPPGKVSGKAVQPQRRDLWAVFEHSWELPRDRKSVQWTTLSSPPPLSSLRPRHHWKV